jgi:SAM-dependent methyltransferase
VGVQKCVAWLRGLGSGALRKRYDVLNRFAARRGYQSYLEIGIASGRCLERVRVADKTGVDPSSPLKNSDLRESVLLNGLFVATTRRFTRSRASSPAWKLRSMTSDEFFDENQRTFDLIFIDGLHLADQVLRDVYNSLAVLNPGGALLLHDCNPADERAQTRDVDLAEGSTWNGDTWKVIAFLRRKRPELFTRVLDLDYGIGVVIPGEREKHPVLADDVGRANGLFAELTYEELERDRGQTLGLVTAQELENELAELGIW